MNKRVTIENKNYFKKSIFQIMLPCDKWMKQVVDTATFKTNGKNITQYAKCSSRTVVLAICYADKYSKHHTISRQFYWPTCIWKLWKKVSKIDIIQSKIGYRQGNPTTLNVLYILNDNYYSKYYIKTFDTL